MVGGQCTSNIFFIFFPEKYAKFSFCTDVNSHVLPAYNPARFLFKCEKKTCQFSLTQVPNEKDNY